MAATAIALGAMQRTVDHATQYARRRKAFGEAIIKHQAVSMRLADLVIALEGLRLYLFQFASDQALERTDAGTVDVLLRQLDDAQSIVCSDALCVMGGHGYLMTSPTAELALLMPRLTMLAGLAGELVNALPREVTA
jgi:alkylation response protein AidB-like acyl-CoA dehydrogenase